MLGLGLLATWLGCAEAETTPTPVDASFSHIRDEILVPSCAFSSCHGSGAGGLTLNAEQAYDQLVGVASTQRPEMLRVKPGAPDESYLMWKLEGHEGIEEDQMPPGGIEAEKIEVIRTWIASGAENDQPEERYHATPSFYCARLDVGRLWWCR